MNEPRDANHRSGGNGSAAAHEHTRELVEQGQRVREDIAALAHTARDVADDWEAILREQLERRPYATLAAAAAIGYVLGGGVPTALVRLLFGMGSRLAAEQAIVRFVASQTRGE